MGAGLLSIPAQTARLRLVHPEWPIIQQEGEPFMVYLQLPDGRQIVSPLPNDETFDLWSSECEPEQFNLTLAQIREAVSFT